MSNQSSALLINEEPLQLLPSLALAISQRATATGLKATGLNEALVLQQLHYWLRKPRMGIVRDGRKWIYNSYAQWQANFPFWSERTLQRIFLNLEDLGLVDSDAPGGRDRKKQYAINYEALNSLTDESESLTPTPVFSDTPSCQVGTMHDGNLSLSDMPSCPDASRQLGMMEDDNLSSPSRQPVRMFNKVSETTQRTPTHSPSPPARASANASSVGVSGSKFSLEICRRYAEHLHSSGQGITNPGGFAKKIYRTGEDDALVAAWLDGGREPGKPPPRDTSDCPDCTGTGFYYPNGFQAGAAKCRHPRLDAPEVARGAPLERSDGARGQPS